MNILVHYPQVIAGPSICIFHYPQVIAGPSICILREPQHGDTPVGPSHSYYKQQSSSFVWSDETDKTRWHGGSTEAQGNRGLAIYVDNVCYSILSYAMVNFGLVGYGMIESNEQPEKCNPTAVHSTA